MRGRLDLFLALRKLRGRRIRDRLCLFSVALWILFSWPRQPMPDRVRPRWRVEVEERSSGLRFCCRADTDDLYHVLPGREGDVARAVHGALGTASVFVDCGANVGSYTVRAAAQIGPAGRVFAIEPVPETADVLRVNVAANRLDNVTVIEQALGAASGEAQVLHDGRRYGVARTVPHRDDDAISTVSMTTLDDLLGRVGRIDVIKLDLEGGELEALRGGAGVLAHTDCVVSEVNVRGDGIVALLLAAGFEVERLDFTQHVHALRRDC